MSCIASRPTTSHAKVDMGRHFAFALGALGGWPGAAEVYAYGPQYGSGGGGRAPPVNLPERSETVPQLHRRRMGREPAPLPDIDPADGRTVAEVHEADRAMVDAAGRGSPAVKRRLGPHAGGRARSDAVPHRRRDRPPRCRLPDAEIADTGKPRSLASTLDILMARQLPASSRTS